MFGTKREQSFLMPNEDKKVFRVPLLIFNRGDSSLELILLSSLTTLVKFSLISLGLPGFSSLKTEVLPL